MITITYRIQNLSDLPIPRDMEKGIGMKGVFAQCMILFTKYSKDSRDYERRSNR